MIDISPLLLDSSRLMTNCLSIFVYRMRYCVILRALELPCLQFARSTSKNQRQRIELHQVYDWTEVIVVEGGKNLDESISSEQLFITI